MPPWLEALYNRQIDLIALAIGLAALVWALGARMNRFAGWRHFTPARLLILAVMTGFVGFWGQGQLSIVTPLGVLRTALEGGTYTFLLYDPFSLMVWAAAGLGFVLWGRGLFCGWLCPFGALQEFAHHFGRALRLPQINPSAAWDKRLKSLKYVALGGLVGLVAFAPQHVDTAAEIEPFKTAISVFFVREWVFVAYAVFWLALGMVLFKGFLPLPLPAWSRHGHRRADPRAQLDRTAQGMWQPVPALSGEMPVWRNREIRQDRLFRMFPMP